MKPQEAIGPNRVTRMVGITYYFRAGLWKTDRNLPVQTFLGNPQLHRGTAMKKP